MIVGALFPSETHPGMEPVGVGLVRETTALTGRPIIGIGGITFNTAGAVRHAGARGIAVIRSVLRAPDPREAAANLKASLIHSGHNRERTNP